MVTQTVIVMSKLMIQNFESLLDISNDLGFASSQDSDQPVHQPSLIRVFTVSMKTAKVLS